MGVDSRRAIQLIVVLLQWKWMRSNQANGFRGVQWAAAAQADHAVAIPPAVHFQPVLDILFHRVGAYIVKK